MFLRLCVVALVGTVQAALADVSENIANQLNQYHKDLPDDCRINSPQMKLTYACQPLEQPGSNPKLHKVHENDKGVNYCFNSLVGVQKNGNRIKITVLKDVGNNVRKFQYSADTKNLKKDSFANYVLPLNGLNASCFAYTEEKNYCSKGFLGFGNTDLPMTIKLDSGAKGSEQSTVIDPDEINSVRRNGSQLSMSQDFDKDEVSKMVLNYARTQLVDHARQAIKNALPNRPNTDAAVRMCEEAIAEFSGTMQAPPLSEEQQRVLKEFDKFRSIQPKDASPVPSNTTR